MDSYDKGLRCQDVNAGLRNFDASSPMLTPVKKTRMIGMAADLASLIRGQDLISNVDQLETVAAAELDIPSTSFDGVLTLLEEAELVELTRSGGDVTGLTSQVPFFRDLYTLLGNSWQGKNPSQFEEELVAVVDRLALGPVALDSLESVTGIERKDQARILELGKSSDLIQEVAGVDGKILYSPFTAFENPLLLGDLAEKHGGDQMLEEFSALRQRQGLAVSNETFPMLFDAVGRGLLLAPSVELPTGVHQSFAALPYTLDRALLVGEKPVLDKALAVIASVRCGEEFGGFTSLRNPVHAINSLLSYGALEPHSSSSRQYRLMRNKGILHYGPDAVAWGKWVTPTLIDTVDNRRALEIARDLIELGESMSGRQVEGAQDLLAANARYLSPMKSVHMTKPKLMNNESDYGKVMAAVMGYGSL